mmetsp:Transcript_15322/g.27829  ORF Transcript_15322/g.27829 Transcript_15322/m.27829 type:complete len:103 (+) Transcript_15322:104-412(+)
MIWVLARGDLMIGGLGVLNSRTSAQHDLPSHGQLQSMFAAVRFVIMSRQPMHSRVSDTEMKIADVAAFADSGGWRNLRSITDMLGRTPMPYTALLVYPVFHD